MTAISPGKLGKTKKGILGREKILSKKKGKGENEKKKGHQ